MPPVFIGKKELQREKRSKYPGITFDMSMCGNLQIIRTILKARKGLVALKAMAAAHMFHKILAILLQALIL